VLQKFKANILPQRWKVYGNAVQAGNARRIVEAHSGRLRGGFFPPSCDLMSVILFFCVVLS